MFPSGQPRWIVKYHVKQPERQFHTGQHRAPSGVPIARVDAGDKEGHNGSLRQRTFTTRNIWYRNGRQPWVVVQTVSRNSAPIHRQFTHMAEYRSQGSSQAILREIENKGMGDL